MMIINFRFYLQRTMRVTLATTPISWPLSDQGPGGEEEEEEGGSPPLKMEEGTRRFSAPTVKGNQVRKCFNFLIQWIQLHSKARKVKVTRLFKSRVSDPLCCSQRSRSDQKLRIGNMQKPVHLIYTGIPFLEAMCYIKWIYQ